ncbi:MULTISPECIES: DUF167 family protein [Chelativorans]|jgi:uncharacterized protein YggU (UPF0235/DUF167 family)|uniref:UPF0235 protein Meso_3232 n=1 Tax=Chelativorans sp. (strain BNC1) TaxID=266779 RepID=Q11DC1_CHESB|nr:MULTISPECIES: DUF167 family protein [Chelativorans]
MPPSSWSRRSKNGIEIFVRLTPKSSSDAIEGVTEGPDGQAFLKARVRAIPEAGKANEALERLLASALGVPRRDVAVSSGAASRRKTVSITGDAAPLIASLDTIAEKRQGGGASAET